MLTKRQLECYKKMKEYKESNGVMPSYEEIMDMMGLSSKSNIHRMIVGMEKRGALKRLPNMARAIKLLPIE